jgi:hypothetical protein
MRGPLPVSKKNGIGTVAENFSTHAISLSIRPLILPRETYVEGKYEMRNLEIMFN